MSDKELDELDRLAAEKIMGFISNEANFCWFKDGMIVINKSNYTPTRNIAQAWEVLEKFKDEDFNISFCVWYYRCNIEASGIYEDDRSAPLAIVKACLKAKGLL